MKTKVAILRMNGDPTSVLCQALELVGGIQELNTPEREVTIKVGIFDPRSRHHTSVEVVKAIISAFDRAPCIYLAESDNYCGKAIDRLQACYGVLFNERVKPFDLSNDPQAKSAVIAGEPMALSVKLMKPNVLVSTHVLRTFAKGSILKNLFGCTPTVQKARYHKNEIYSNLLANIAEAAGGIDLSVLDGAFLLYNATEKRLALDLLIVGRDAVAVETVGAVLGGLKPEKLPHLQEFVRRGLGVGDMDEIEIVGLSEGEFAQLRKAYKELKNQVEAEPRQPGISDTIDCLIQEGWLDVGRSANEVTAELMKRGITTAVRQVVETTLKRRVGKKLQKVKKDGLWFYSKIAEN